MRGDLKHPPIDFSIFVLQIRLHGVEEHGRRGILGQVFVDEVVLADQGVVGDQPVFPGYGVHPNSTIFIVVRRKRDELV